MLARLSDFQCKKSGMPRVQLAQTPRQREISGPLDRLRLESMCNEYIFQAAVCKNEVMLPAPRRRRGLPVMYRQRVSDLEAFFAYIGEGKRLPPKDEGEDIVPTAQIFGADDGIPPRLQDSPDFFYEMIGILQVLDDLIGMDDLEKVVLERKGLIEVARFCNNPFPESHFPSFIHNFNPVEADHPDLCAQLQRPVAIITAAIQQGYFPVGGCQALQNAPTIIRNCAISHFLQEGFWRRLQNIGPFS